MRGGIVPVVFALMCSALWAETRIEDVDGEGIAVATNPAGANVFIDGVEQGKTPLVLSHIAPGTHTILITKDNYEDWRKQVSFARKSRLNVNVDLSPATGQLTIKLRDAESASRIEPREAQVLIDLQVQKVFLEEDGGLTLRAPEGQKNITIRVFGYDEEKKTARVVRGRNAEIEIALRPARLRIEKLRVNRTALNPANEGNLGALAVTFTVNARGYGLFSVFNEHGDLVFERLLGKDGAPAPFETWNQRVEWAGDGADGRSVGEGRYRLRVAVSQSAQFPKTGADAPFAEAWTRVDYGAQIFPLSLSRGKAGLENAEYARVLPSGAFQISAALFTGAFSAAHGAFSRVPFAAAARVSPRKTYEAAAAFHIAPLLDTAAAPLFGASLRLKKELRHSARLVPGVALGLGFGYVNGVRETDAGLAAGADLGAAFSWRLPHGFSLLAAPAVQWTGENGYPEEAAPRLELSGGLLWTHRFFVAGLSARSAARFSGAHGFSPVNITAELFAYPPPSNFAFGVSSRCVIDAGTPRISGGLTFSIIH
jgi:hypothetical protein